MKIVIILLMLSLGAMTQEKSCKTIPETPIVGERFQFVCRIEVTGDEVPLLTFRKTGLEVLGKRVTDANIRSTVKNGKITTFKEKKFVYDMIASQSGRRKIYGIKIDTGDDIRTIRDIYVDVLTNRPRAKDYFVIAEPEKKSVYVGEGFDVKYYLFFRVMRLAHEVEEWPKIKGFYKRDLNVLGSNNIESVEYEGKRYKRVLVSSMRLFAEKPGEHKVASIKVEIQFRGKKNFGMLGGYPSSIRKSIRSEPVKMDVKALPLKGMPKSFGGLVGKHHFDLKIRRKRFIVNEPIEIQLSITGKGNLEQYVAPALYRNGNLEEFDRQSEIIKDGAAGYKKKVDYTYLARSEIDLKARNVEVTYFSLSSEKYVSKKIALPSLLVRGAGVVKVKAPKTEEFEQKEEIPLNRLIAPVFYVDKILEYRVFYINSLLGLVLLVLLISLVDWRDKMPGVDQNLAGICRKIKRKGPNYSLVYQLVGYLSDDGTLSVEKKIKNSGLSVKGKKYFSELVNMSEKDSYGKKGSGIPFRYRKKYFQEFVGYVTRIQVNENHKQNREH